MNDAPRYPRGWPEVVAHTLRRALLPLRRGFRRPGGEAAATSPLSATALYDRLAMATVAVVVDVRDAEDYRAGHIPGALSLPLPELDRRLAELEGWRDRPVAVVCRTDKRSSVAVRRLRAAGFLTPILVGGGMCAWDAAGLPIARDDREGGG